MFGGDGGHLNYEMYANTKYQKQDDMQDILIQMVNSSMIRCPNGECDCPYCFVGYEIKNKWNDISQII